MKLLFDQNLSPRLVELLEDCYPASRHVLIHALDCASDEAVWAFAREHGYTLVTKDSDFHELSVLRGSPPKVVWIRVGNCTTLQIEAILRKHVSDVQALNASQEADFLLLY